MNLRRTLAVASLLVAASVVIARDARAQADPPSPPAPSPAPTPASELPPPPSAPPPPLVWPLPPKRRWYGWETLIVDGAGLATLAVSARTDSNAVSTVGLGIYLFGPPIVHGVKGHVGTAFGDFGIRLTAPIVTGIVGYAIDNATSSPCSPGAWLCFRGLGGAALGGLIGYAAAVALDAAWLAREDVPARRDASSEPLFRWSPTVGVVHRGASVGVGGSF